MRMYDVYYQQFGSTGNRRFLGKVEANSQAESLSLAATKFDKDIHELYSKEVSTHAFFMDFGKELAHAE